MSILSLPALDEHRAVRFFLRTNTLNHVSDLNKSTQTVEFPGARWGMEVTLPPMPRATAEPWLAFLAELDGMAGRFYGGPLDAQAPQGAVGTSAPLVKGASQTGKSLETDGWDTSVTGIMLAGDWFAVDLPSGGRSLHKLTADANSNPSGEVTLNFRPALRESPADNATVIISAATCVMRLEDGDGADWNVGEDGFYHISFSALESFNTGA